jgi:hypothetical protein
MAAISQPTGGYTQDISATIGGPGGPGKPGEPGTPAVNNPGAQRGVTKVGQGGPLSPGPSAVVVNPGLNNVGKPLVIDQPVKADKALSTWEQNNSTTSVSKNDSDPWDPSVTTTTTGAAGVASKSTTEDLYGDTSTTVSVGPVSITTSNESEGVTISV